MLELPNLVKVTQQALHAGRAVLADFGDVEENGLYEEHHMTR